MLFFILTTAITPVGAWPVFILLLSLSLSCASLSHLGIVFVLKRSAIALPFLLAALPVIFTVRGNIISVIDLGLFSLSISQPGLERFLTIALKSWISVQSAILLTATTPFQDIMLALRWIHLPRVFVEIISLMWRYLFIIGEEALRMLKARLSRSSQSNQPGMKTGGTIYWRAQVTGGMAGSLFLRSIERSDRVYQAMLSRGYDGEIRSMQFFSIPAGDRRVMIGGFFCIGLLLFSGQIFW